MTLGPALSRLPFVEPSNISSFSAPEGFRRQQRALNILHTGCNPGLASLQEAMSRSFYVDSLIIKDSVSPTPQHTAQDFFIPIGMHAPGVMGVPAAACPSRKSGAFCVCPLCVATHVHSPRAGLPLLKAPGYPSGDAPYCQRLAQHHNSVPVCTPPAYSVTDPRRYHCLSIGKAEQVLFNTPASDTPVLHIHYNLYNYI